MQIQIQMQIQMQILKSRCGHPPPLHLKVNCKDGPTGRHCGEEVEGDQQEEGGEGHQGNQGKQGEPTMEHSVLKFQPNLALKIPNIRRTILDDGRGKFSLFLRSLNMKTIAALLGRHEKTSGKAGFTAGQSNGTNWS